MKRLFTTIWDFLKRVYKRITRRPAVIIVTWYARLLYEQGVEAAERRHKREGATIYLAADSWHPERLVTYSKPQFKTEKRIYGVSAQLITMNTLRRECYYHTADRFGRNGMSLHDREVRRRAFIRERLRHAGLA